MEQRKRLYNTEDFLLIPGAQHRGFQGVRLRVEPGTNHAADRHNGHLDTPQPRLAKPKLRALELNFEEYILHQSPRNRMHNL
jgi:hypothetical protein